MTRISETSETVEAASKLPTVGRSVGGMFVLRVAAQLVTALTVIIITRALGPDEFGRYAFLFGFLGIFTLFNVNGLNDILVREIAARPDQRERIWRAGLALKLIAGATAFVAAILILALFDITDLPSHVWIIAALTLFVSFSMGSVRLVWDVNYQVDFRMTTASAINFSGRLLLLAALALIGMQSSNPDGGRVLGLAINTIAGGVATVILLQILSEFAGASAQGIFNVRFGYNMLPRWDSQEIRRLVGEVWPLAVSGAMGMIYSRVNLILLQYYQTEREVGLFALPAKLTDALSLIPTVFIWAVMPILSRLHAVSSAEFLNLTRISHRLMIIAALPAAIFVTVHAGTIITFISGESYSEAAPAMQLLIWNVVFSFTGLVFAYVLVASGMQRRLMMIYSVQAVGSVLLSALLIPRFGIQGAAWATLATNFLQFPLAFLFVDIRPAGMIWLKALYLPMAAAGFVSALLMGLHAGMALSLAVVLIALLVMIFIFRYLDGKDFMTLARIIRSRAGDA